MSGVLGAAALGVAVTPGTAAAFTAQPSGGAIDGATEASLGVVRAQGTVTSLASGYRVFRFRVPRRTTYLAGDGPRPGLRIEVEADIPVQSVGRSGITRAPADAGEGEGRPTAR